MTAAGTDPLEALDFTPTFQCECKGCKHDTRHADRCTQAATYRVGVHAIDACTHPVHHATGGRKITLLCPDCMFDASHRTQELAEQVRELARLVNFHRVCRGCGMALDDPANYMEAVPL